MRPYSARAKRRIQQAVLERDKFKCGVCKCHTIAPPHHIIYRSQGGSDTMENLITLCGPLEHDCHRAVHDHRINLSDHLQRGNEGC